MNAKGESYCICTQEYTGDLCDKKTGCYGDPVINLVDSVFSFLS